MPFLPLLSLPCGAFTPGIWIPLQNLLQQNFLQQITSSTPCISEILWQDHQVLLKEIHKGAKRKRIKTNCHFHSNTEVALCGANDRQTAAACMQCRKNTGAIQATKFCLWMFLDKCFLLSVRWTKVLCMNRRKYCECTSFC